MYFVLPMEIHCLNLMRYHGVFIKNTFCHLSSSIMTQSMDIYGHFKVSPMDQSLLLILVQAQLPLKIESTCNIIAW